MTSLRSSSAAETERLGAEVAAGLAPGDVVLVSGELGAGKTTFVRGACRALGVEGPVVSPTFTIGRRYAGKGGLAVSHLDLYRLADLETEDPALLEDYLTPDAVAFIEWPGVASADVPDPAAVVMIRHAGGDSREIDVERTSQ
ncbi:MAG TPA: tRNA (adenosine(37)-N6)-threonylcarbamoyltransferase complex ATPase subunit type 1 TsaE [Solirubrobacterales bacterium]|nr:tRNA (adenosine(37)-N6)-threonylcarbamoyltransferase complex ATPase subunit type 1 TsaE [Solirubrobacterales bacterium]